MDMTKEFPALPRGFFERDAVIAARELAGCRVARRMPDGSLRVLTITETEAYCGEEDSACHAHRGKTRRNAPLYERGGIFYVYLCYGIHWMLNAVTGPEGRPQGVLIRACEGEPGPGRLTRALAIDGSFTGLEVDRCPELRFVPREGEWEISTAPRVGIGYASPEDQARPWRFIARRAD